MSHKKSPPRFVTLTDTEVKDLKRRYNEMSDIVQCLSLKSWAALEVVRIKPDRVGELIKKCTKLDSKIHRQMQGFQSVLDRALRAKTAKTMKD